MPQLSHAYQPMVLLVSKLRQFKKIYSTGTEWASVHSSVTLPGVADVPIQGCEKHLSRGRSRTIAFLGGADTQ